MASHWATWANLLTAARLASIPAICFSILFADWWLAAALFTLAVISDVYDGRLARRFAHESNFGGAFDHATDALFVTACCAVLAASDFITPVLWPLIILSFTQYLLDSKTLVGQPLRASIIGRCNGIAYFALVGTAIGAMALDIAWIMTLVTVAAWILCATTVLSMLDRAWALYRLLS